jgi:O-acetyl-ADP-ribose deacetylase (regulator of RNase III)
MTIHYIKGDATEPVGDGNKIIIHICNNRGGWGRGFVNAISRKWSEPEKVYRRLFNTKGLHKDDMLGVCQPVKVEDNLWVMNMIAQNGYKSSSNPVPLDYIALKTCLFSVLNYCNNLNASVHAPRIGCGLAGGEWSKVEELLNEVLVEEGHEIYIYDL